MKWRMPPKVKVYEAMGAVTDGRVRVDGNTAQVTSSNGDKVYAVNFDGDKAIMTNDNGSYWQGYLGYPAIAFLMKIGKIIFDKSVSEALKGIEWNEINKKFKADYSKTIDYCLSLAKDRGVGREKVESEIDRIYKIIEDMKLEMLGKKLLPPKG